MKSSNIIVVRVLRIWGGGGRWDASNFPILSCVNVSMAIGSYRDLSYNICIARE